MSASVLVRESVIATGAPTVETRSRRAAVGTSLGYSTPTRRVARGETKAEPDAN